VSATEQNTEAARPNRALWVQVACRLLVAPGADETKAAIWPLIVDGLLTTATVELWKTGTASPPLALLWTGSPPRTTTAGGSYARWRKQGRITNTARRPTGTDVALADAS
jgi:hypothetical protein